MINIKKIDLKILISIYNIYTMAEILKELNLNEKQIEELRKYFKKELNKLNYERNKAKRNEYYKNRRKNDEEFLKKTRECNKKCYQNRKLKKSDEK